MLWTNLNLSKLKVLSLKGKRPFWIQLRVNTLPNPQPNAPVKSIDMQLIQLILYISLYFKALLQAPISNSHINILQLANIECNVKNLSSPLASSCFNFFIIRQPDNNALWLKMVLLSVKRSIILLCNVYYKCTACVNVMHVI